MDALEKRCIQNGIEIERLSQEALTAREPSIIGVGALYAKATGITDYPKITTKMAELFAELGGEVRYGSEVQAIAESVDQVEIHLAADSLKTRYAVACGGLMADRLAKMMNIAIDILGSSLDPNDRWNRYGGSQCGSGLEERGVRANQSGLLRH